MSTAPTIVTAGALRSRLRGSVPFALRLAAVRAPALLARIVRPPARLPRAGTSDGDRAAYAFVAAERRTPLRRATTTYDEALQRGKERNVARAVRALDGAVLRPGAVLSWHAEVGPPLRARGFVPGPELHQGVLVAGVGGGACQVANLLYWLAVHAGLDVVERHRHALDLFPDHDRTAPFGCGATVFWPSADLRVRNSHGEDVVVELAVDGGDVVGRIRCRRDPGVRWEIVERDARFVRHGGHVWRENRLVRRRHEGGRTVDELLCENRAKVAYAVDAALVLDPEATASVEAAA